MSSGYVLVVGANSAIGRAIATRLSRHYLMLLAGRDAAEIETVAADIRVRTDKLVATIAYDALTTDASAFFARCLDLSGNHLDGIILCQGSMDEGERAKNDPNAMARLVSINFTSPVAILTAASAWFEQRKRGFLVGVASVAGDRGRQSNYPYGSTKAAFATWLEGLRHRMFRSGVTVLTVKPGFVDTAMTWGLNGLFLVASAESVAKDVERAIHKRRRVLYTPWFWRWIMAIIRNVPAPVFLRSKL